MILIPDFELEDSKTMMKCSNCEYGLVKSYKTLFRDDTVIILGVCDSCNELYQSSEKCYGYQTLMFTGC